MSILDIKTAFEIKLSQMSPAISTSYESSAFTPVAGVPYQYVQLVPQTPENTVIDAPFYREQGEIQIFLAYPSNKGTGEVLKRAQAVRDHFKRGTNLVRNGLTILIYRTPTISGSQIVGDRVVVPIIVKYTADVNVL